MREPLETAELLAFTKIVEARSLTRAASELRAPRATISRRLARLERRLGARLVRRTTRSLALTDAGEALYRQARNVLDAVAIAEATVRRREDVVAGELRVSVPPIADAGLHELLVTFAHQHPEVRLQVHASWRQVDLQRERFDVAIRAGSSIAPGLVARTLFQSKVVAVASPGYLAQHGTPRTARDLRGHRCLLGFAQAELPQTHWRIDGRLVHVDGVFFANDVGLRCAGAARGLGITTVPSLFAAERIARGELVMVLERANLGTDSVAAVYRERELMPAQVRAFVDAIARWRPAVAIG
jgi:DNA-binding transcriptional LysR family regulator